MTEAKLARDRRLAWGIVLAAIALAAVVRFHLRGLPLERDEGEFAYAGRLLLEGVPPYRLAYSMKLPGIYAVYALVMALFGRSAEGIRLGVLLATSVSTILLFRLARRFLEPLPSAAAAASFALLALSQKVLGVYGHATHFVVLAALGGLLLLPREGETWRAPRALACGLLFGAAYIVKQHAIVLLVFALLWIVRDAARSPSEARLSAARRSGVFGPGAARRAGLFALGAALPFAGVCVWLFATGDFARFWLWTFRYAGQYVSLTGPAQGLRNLAEVVPWVAAPSLLFWILALVGLAAPAWDVRARKSAPFLLGFLVFSFLAICPGLYFRDHYFILLLPPAALLVGVAVSSLGALLTRSSLPRFARSAPWVLLVIAAAQFLFAQREFFLATDPRLASRRTFGADPFPEDEEIAKYIRARTSPGDRIAVFGSEPTICFYADRRSATGHLYMYPLVEKQKYSLPMQQQMIREIEAADPAYFVFVDYAGSWMALPGSERAVLDWFEAYRREHLEMVGIVDVQSQETTVYRWDRETEGYAPSSGCVLFVFKKKDARSSPPDDATPSSTSHGAPSTPPPAG